MRQSPQPPANSIRSRLTRVAERATPLMVVVAITIALGTVQLFAGASSTGVTTDEPTHVDRTNIWLETGWYVPHRHMEGSAPNPDRPSATPFVYGPAYSVLAHFANVALRNDDLLAEVSQTSEGYAIRHMLVALISLLTVAAVGITVFLLTRSKRLGSVSYTHLRAH